MESRVFKFKSVFKTFLGPGVYYADLISDSLMAIDLYQNCHYRYLSFCLSIIVVSYLTTALFLKFRGLTKNCLTAFLYPFYHIKHLFKQIKAIKKLIFNNVKLPEETEEHVIYVYHITFIEATSESVLQLCLSMLIFREFGFKKWIQIASLSTSAISLYTCFVKRQMYMRYNQKPKNAILYLQSALYWLIPMLSFFNSLIFQVFTKTFTPFAMAVFGFSIHPFVVIPVGYISKGVRNIYAKIICIKNFDWRSAQYDCTNTKNCCKVLCMRTVTFSMAFYIVYMVFVLAIVIEVLLLNDIKEFDFLKVKNFNQKIEYNQCKSNGTNTNKDITEYVEGYIFDIENYFLIVLILAFLVPIVEVMIICLPPPIPLLDFMLGPDLPKINQKLEESNAKEEMVEINNETESVETESVGQ